MWFSRAAVRELGAAGWRPDAAAARTVGFSSRAFARRNASGAGKSPLSYFQRLRAEPAVLLLKTSSESVDEIAAHALAAATRPGSQGALLELPEIKGIPREFRSISILFARSRGRRQFSQEHGDGLSGKLRAVKGRRRKPAEG